VSEEDEHHGERYKLGRKFEGGGHGEIWRAYKVIIKKADMAIR
jgi:hypothetical protein